MNDDALTLLLDLLDCIDYHDIQNWQLLGLGLLAQGVREDIGYLNRLSAKMAGKVMH